jgi:N-methylhydantoinase B/oxoprolinase/acetone carboxylase alpha subunit
MAGGNVETSQRLVDLLLRALGRPRGLEQGTMNNLTVGRRPEGLVALRDPRRRHGASPRAAGRGRRASKST